ncbi:MAG: transglycosylase SLT domain-containing protein [Bdellovibrionaceae bacterium]|nr:transglycosylase SLT domain-containing protein [Pseudobdellovibrionaceae bacterium]
MRKLTSVVLSITAGITTLFAGCSTVSINQSPNLLTQLPNMDEVAPGKDLESVDIYLRKRLAENPSPALEWWTRYQQAKLWAQDDSAKSCGHYKTLGSDTEFPLRHIAMLRALEACSSEDLSLPPLEQLLSTITDPWLQEVLVRTVHARATRTGELGLEMKLAGDVALHSTLQSEKIQLLNRAIELAETLQQPEAKSAYQARLEKVAPRFRKDPKPQEWLDVALDFRKAREFEKARAFYRKAIAHRQISDADRLKAIDGIRLAYKLEKRVDEYVAATHELADFARAKFRKRRSPSWRAVWTEKLHDTQLLLARTLWTEKTVPEALHILDRLEKDLSGRHPLDEINWLRARIEEEAGRFEVAVDILNRTDGSKNPNRTMIEKIRWYKAWNLNKLGRHQEAIDALQELNQRFTTLTNQPRNRFWIAKALLKLGRDDDAKQEFESLIETDPLGYYGLLSYRELRRDLPPAQVRDTTAATPPASSTPPSSLSEATPNPTADAMREPAAAPALPSGAPSPFANSHDHAYVEWLLSLGELPIARRFLDHYTAARGMPAHDSPEGREMLKYLARAGNFHALFAKLGSFSPELRSRTLADDPTLLFPQPYTHFVSEAGRKFGVATELMYAIMRQESSFDPQARSHADAFGLMQLIPEAARRVENTSGIRLNTPEDLYRPEVNVTLGAAFLRDLLNQYDEQFVLTVASYNASEKAIRGWMKTRFRGDALQFIEDIPYEETRGYVKLVLRNYIFYLRLNSGGRSVPFPDWCLDSLHDFNS